MFITYGWYAPKWWEIAGDSRKYNCTAEERASVLTYTLAPLIPEFPTGVDTVAEPNIVSYPKETDTWVRVIYPFLITQTESQFNSLYKDAAIRDINQNINLTEDVFSYAYHCHEATLTFVYALNQTIAGV